MSRLPNPGQDNGTWGNILNDFLSVEHNPDGTLKASGSLASKADASSVVHLTGNESIGGTKTFVSSPIVPTPSLSNQAATKGYVDTSLAAGAPDATASAKGLIQLGGDLAGSGSAAAAPVISSGAITASKLANGVISDVHIATSAAIARTKLDASTQTSLGKADTALQAASNLSDLSNISLARTNLGLGTAATKNVGTTTGTVAAGDDSRLVQAPSKSFAIAMAVVL